MFPQQTPELMIISTIHNKPCKYTPGDHYNFMSIVNKQVVTAFTTSFHPVHLLLTNILRTSSSWKDARIVDHHQQGTQMQACSLGSRELSCHRWELRGLG